MISDKYIRFFLDADSSIVQYDTIELSQPSFSKFYRIVRNNVDGITATLETGNDAVFQYYPLKIEGAGARDDLDYSITLIFGDLGEILPTELDAVIQQDTFDKKPRCIYRAYRSDDLSEPLVVVELQITTITFDKNGAEMEAKAPELNINATGEVYKIDRFPMLRGLI